MRLNLHPVSDPAKFNAARKIAKAQNLRPSIFIVFPKE